MTEIERFRYRIQFEKNERIRFISHLDLHRTWERTLRRAALPLYHSQGYNPRPKINLSRALPLGQTSECELADIWLEQDLSLDQLSTSIEASLPPGLSVNQISRVPLTSASLQSSICSASYRVTPADEVDLQTVKSSIDRILNAEQLIRVRRGKEYDLRPLIESLSISSMDDSQVNLSMRLAAREGASGRPDEVLSEMGLDPALALIHRTRLFFEGDSTG